MSFIYQLTSLLVNNSDVFSASVTPCAEKGSVVEIFLTQSASVQSKATKSPVEGRPAGELQTDHQVIQRFQANCKSNGPQRRLPRYGGAAEWYIGGVSLGLGCKKNLCSRALLVSFFSFLGFLFQYRSFLKWYW